MTGVGRGGGGGGGGGVDERSLVRVWPGTRAKRLAMTTLCRQEGGLFKNGVICK